MMASLSLVNVVEVDGTRVEFSDGSWILARWSGTEPVLRLYAEAHDLETVDELLMGTRSLLGV